MLDMRQKKAVTKELKARYNRATKKKKTVMLDEFCAVTGYNRSYASWILKIKKQKVLGCLRTGGKTIKFVAENKKRKKKKKGRPRIYTYDVFLALKRIWTVFDFICGKRLAPFMAEAVRKLEKHKELDITAGVRKKLSMLSASTIDRLLKKEKEKFRLGKGKTGTKPGTLLKKSIPIRTFADWDDAVPGFCECDLVGHDGGNTSGDFAQSLNFTDIATLIIMAADKYGNKELLAVSDGYRESKLGWSEMLLDLKARGLKVGPNLSVGDGGLGFWAALDEVYPNTKRQRCWVHKTGNILDKMPKSVQSKAKSMIHDMYMAPTKEDALSAYDHL